MHAKNTSSTSQGTLLRFSLQGLLPAHQTLIVNPSARTAILLNQAQIVAEEQFSRNGMRVLVPLLQAYPQHCPYTVLLAIGQLAPGLATFGLHVRSLRDAGYLLEARSLPQQ